jgi:drug/metabolite transporter (DMT)-like permease
MAARKWIDVSSPTLSQVQIDNAIKGSNIGVGITLGLVAAILLAGIWIEARRLLRARAAQPGRPVNGLPDRPITS